MEPPADESFEKARAAYRDGGLEDARLHFAEALRAAQEDSDRTVQAESLVGIGKIDRDLGDLDSARSHYLRAVEVFRTLDEPLRLAHTIRHVGDIHYDLADHEEAVPHYEEALNIYRKHSAPPMLDLANTVAGYARLQYVRGDRAACSHLWHEARALYASAGVRSGVDEANESLELLRNTPA
jgi:tetratricopeptide (TPR) repeat protein